MNNNIHDLIAKYFSGLATPQEELEVRSWVNESQENLAEFNLLEKLWKASGEETTIVFDTQKAWQAVDAKIKSGERQITRRGVIRRMAAIAAAACLVLLLGLWWLMADRTPMQSVLAERDGQEVKLQDGSVVYLRSGSELIYPASFKDGRNVELKGEAFFEVARDESKPFSIIAKNAKVLVLGTSFLVSTKADSVELIVRTGKVQFSEVNKSENKLLVVANERALLQDGRLTKQKNIDQNFIAWQTKQIVFSDTPLEKVIATLNDYYKVEIRPGSDMSNELKTSRITASFNNQPLSAVLNELSQITSYRITKINDTLYQISLK